jgi:hypothetical protein
VGPARQMLAATRQQRPAHTPHGESVACSAARRVTRRAGVARQPRAAMQAQAPSASSGVGVPLPGATHASCVYLDYNATTPIFPEARWLHLRRLWLRLCAR